MSLRVQLAVKRFAKAFIAGGLASAAALLAAGVSIKSLDEAKNFAVILATAFIVGGLMGLEKAINFDANQTSNAPLTRVD